MSEVKRGPGPLQAASTTFKAPSKWPSPGCINHAQSSRRAHTELTQSSHRAHTELMQRARGIKYPAMLLTHHEVPDVCPHALHHRLQPLPARRLLHHPQPPVVHVHRQHAATGAAISTDSTDGTDSTDSTDSTDGTDSTAPLLWSYCRRVLRPSALYACVMAAQMRGTAAAAFSRHSYRLFNRLCTGSWR